MLYVSKVDCLMSDPGQSGEFHCSGMEEVESIGSSEPHPRINPTPPLLAKREQAERISLYWQNADDGDRDAA